MKKQIKDTQKNKYGQYFTPEVVADFMIDLADISLNSKILEPSCGEGIFITLLQRRLFNNITAYEIDPLLSQEFDCVQHKSFVSTKIDEKFDLIIGNPPYIRWKNLEKELKHELLSSHLWNKYFNSLCDYLYIFILKSIELLNDNGQLIFICPEYWMNTTHSLTLRNYMVANGYFEKIYHFNEAPIFDKVTASIVIFKYIKSRNKKENIDIVKFAANKKLTPEILEKIKKHEAIKDVEYLEASHFKANERWLLTTPAIKTELQIFEKHCKKQTTTKILSLFNEPKVEFNTIGDYCDIGNGLVSGLDKAFQLNGQSLNEKEQQAILSVLKAKDLKPFWNENITRYIFLNDGLDEHKIITEYPNFHEHLQLHKKKLEQRYQYNRKIHYWEWVFLRNYKLFSKQEKRIFVPCKERISNKNFFRFSLVDKNIYPTQDVTAVFKKTNTRESIEYILSYLNNPRVFYWLKFNGILKGHIVEFSEKPISSIPFKAINWSNEQEVQLHNTITQLTTKYIRTHSAIYLKEINCLFDELLKNKNDSKLQQIDT